MELSLDIMFCVYVCADLSKIILMYIVLGAIELLLIPFLLTFFFLIIHITVLENTPVLFS